MIKGSERLSIQSNCTEDRGSGSRGSRGSDYFVPQDKTGLFHEKSDYEKAGVFSKLHFFFGFKLIRRINALGDQPLTEEHLDPVGKGEDCQTLEKLFTTYYHEYRLRYPRSNKAMFRAMLKLFKKDMIIQLFFQLLFGASRVITAYFLYGSLLSIKNPDQTVKDASPLAAGLFLGLLMGLYTLHQFTFRATYTANKIKLGILGMVYRKITRLSLLSVHRASLGKILNVVMSDANNLENIHYLASVVAAPFILGGAAWVFYYLWGCSGLVGVGYMMFCWIIVQVIASVTRRLRRQRSAAADERMRLLNEILEIVKLIKFCAWELFGYKTLSEKRRQEIKEWKKIYFLDAFSRAIVFSSNWIAIFLLFVVYTLLGNQIVSAKIFPTVLLMSYLRQIGMIHVSSGLNYFIQLGMLFDRLISIMDLPEVRAPIDAIPPKNKENAIELQDFTGFWPRRDLSPQDLAKLPLEPLSTAEKKELKEAVYPVISNINLEIKKGSLVIISGKGGCGKTSLLLSFSREMAKSLGEIRFAGTFEYMPQTPMFLAGSIRDNVTFGKPYNIHFFWKVVEACCLTEEINNFPNKENTEIGERGAKLNARQKALIGLARSLYSRADIYLLDDPFSELEPDVVKTVFNRAIEVLLKGATVLLVTKDTSLHKHANRIVLMEDGKIIGDINKGSRNQMLTVSDVDLREDIGSATAKLRKTQQDNQTEFATEGAAPLVRRGTFTGLLERHIPIIDSDVISEEAKLEEGKVAISTYWKYFRTVFNWINIVPLLILFVGAEAAGWQLSVRLAEWPKSYSDTQGYVIIGTIVFGGLFLHLLKLLLYYNSSMNGTEELHNKMLKGVLNIPLTQFAKYSIGRILNRFSLDIASLDGLLMMALLDVLEGFCSFMIFVIALWVKEPWILALAGVVVVAYLALIRLCNTAITKTRNLTRATRSPLYSMITATIEGLTAIRARNQTENMIKSFCRRANDNSKANISYRVSVRVMCFFLDYITQIVVIGGFSYLLYQQQSPLLEGGFVNLLVQLPSMLQWFQINLMNLHFYMVSAQRVLSYCEKSDEDEGLKLGDEEPQNAPEEMVELSKITNKFTETDKTLLRNILSNVKAGQKVAVVGDTKASLSTLAYYLSTTQETYNESGLLSPMSGDRIKMADNNIIYVRDSMTILTNEIYIMTASIRDNLDPRKEYKENELWEVLDMVGLKEFVESLKNRLDTPLSKGSSVFSDSQDQLICIARAMLRKTNILIQDRATNKIDITVDQVLQKKIEERFQNSAIVTATNRVLDIAGYDKVLYVKSGVKHEFDEPYNLLVKEVGDKEITNKKGGFAKLVLGMDANTSKEVSRLAMTSFCEKRGLDFHLDQKSFYILSDCPMKSLNDVTSGVSLVLNDVDEKVLSCEKLEILKNPVYSLNVSASQY